MIQYSWLKCMGCNTHIEAFERIGESKLNNGRERHTLEIGVLWNLILSFVLASFVLDLRRRKNLSGSSCLREIKLGM